MNRRPHRLLWLIAASATLVGGVSWFVFGRAADPPPSFEEACALARAGRFAEAQTLLERFLAVFPDHPRANLLMAQFATDRPDAQPDLALRHLRLIRPTTFEEAALLRFWSGKAYFRQGRYDLAESSWAEALRLNPTVPEAGPALLDLYGQEGRREEAHALALRLHAVEPDPRDRVRILLNAARLDIDRPSPASQVLLVEPLVKQVPGNPKLSVTLGLALVHDSRQEQGVEVLRDVLRRHPDSAEVWDAWLTGLDDAGRPEEHARELARLPEPLSADPRFAKHQGLAAQTAHDWKSAARAYGRATAHEPYDGVILYRLHRALRFAGDTAEAERVGKRLSTFQSAYKQLRGVVDEAFAIKTLGLEPRPQLYQRLADLRERMGRPDEARAWHRLVLRDDPGQAVSLAALERLR
jgi:tetratricopeptide (TPR) repeat protein